jgi:hypothetical protein
MAGTMSAQNVIMMSPGTISRTSPIVIRMPAMIDAAVTGPSDGSAAVIVLPTDRSTRPSRMSCTDVTSAAWTR